MKILIAIIVAILLIRLYRKLPVKHKVPRTFKSRRDRISKDIAYQCVAYVSNHGHMVYQLICTDDYFYVYCDRNAFNMFALEYTRLVASKYNFKEFGYDQQFCRKN